MSERAEQPRIKAGQVWRRNSDGVEVVVIDYHRWFFGDEFDIRYSVRSRDGKRTRRQNCYEQSFRARYTLIPNPAVQRD